MMRDPVAELDPGGDQALGQGVDLGEEVGRGDVLPSGIGVPAQRDAVGVLAAWFTRQSVRLPEVMGGIRGASETSFMGLLLQ